MQALKNESITVYGDGTQTRSFCYVDDLIDGMIKLMNTPNDFTGPVNIGNAEEITIHQLAEQIVKQAMSNSKIIYHALPLDDPLKRKPDDALAAEKLDWRTQITLEVGLKHTIAYFSEKVRTQKSKHG